MLHAPTLHLALPASIRWARGSLVVTCLMRLCCLIPIPVRSVAAGPGTRRSFSRPEHRFALSLTTGVGGELFTCHVVRVKDGKVLDASPLTRDQFVWQAQGVIPSLANPQGRDLFADHGIEPRQAVTDSSGRRYGTFCPVLDDLWKLRFWEYPFKPMEGAAQHPGQGWAERAGKPFGTATAPAEQLRVPLRGRHLSWRGHVPAVEGHVRPGLGGQLPEGLLNHGFHGNLTGPALRTAYPW